MIIAAILLAAVITERNDLWTIAPDSAVFRGTSSAPGIESCWIPYGTYTGGTGGEECTRVTSNLAGVVVSALDGGFERDYRWQVAPTQFPEALQLDSISNSTRIVELLSRGPFGSGLSLDRWLASTEREVSTNASTNVYLSGVAAYYGSRALSRLVGELDPPISTSWSESLPFSAGESNTWANAFPTYGMLKADGCIWPTNAFAQVYRRSWLLSEADRGWGWARPFHLADIQGDDAYMAASNLWTTLLGIPASPTVTVQDVLSTDTSWTTNEYARWDNGTTRLDWIRLGLICQMERQMEETVEVRGTEDYLPFVESWASNERGYEGSYELSFDIPASGPGSKVGEIPLSAVQWNLATNRVETNTTVLGWCYPTARAAVPLMSGSIEPRGFQSDSQSTIWIDDATMLGNLEMWAGYGTGGMSAANIKMVCAAASLSVRGNTIVLETGEMRFYNDADPGETGSYYSHEITGGAPGHVNASIGLAKGFRKSAYTMYTRSRAEDGSAVQARLEDLPSAVAWSNDVVAAFTLPSLDFMLCTSGTGAVGYVSEDISPMAWNDISNLVVQGTAAAWRGWRYSAGDTVGSRSASLARRVAALSTLNAEVHSKFASIAGLASDAAAEQRSAVTQGDMEEAERGFARKLDVTYGLLPASDGPLVISADVSRSGGSASLSNLQIEGLIHGQNGWAVGTISLQVESTSSGVDLSENLPPVRVDGHQNQLLRTLWRFKNLRDPNL